MMNKAMEIEKLATATANDPRWLSVVERNKTADGTFYNSRFRAAENARNLLSDHLQLGNDPKTKQ
jgi:hypothetical protein